jgi:uncharacterized protein YprB with RNaseH-like and TPR domain
MTARGFRDRYAALTVPAPDVHRRSDAAAEWPLPAGARYLDTHDGPCSVHDQVYAGEAVSAAHAAFQSCLDAGHLGSAHPRDIVFLDTETTGLAGGTGTHVFLVGIGRFSGPALVVRQFFMRHPGDERALLAALAREIGDVELLVTYNGRAFDVPLLETRYRLHGRAFNQPFAHRDLLAATRAIWKHRLPSCALAEIERAILGVERLVDAPGWLIPQLYFGYLRSRQIDALEPVFEHNRADIVSLARLAALVQLYEAGLEQPAHEIDRLAVALHRLRRLAAHDAIADLMLLWQTPTIPAALRLRALQELTTTLRRRGEVGAAVGEWQRGLADPSRAVRQYAAEELAKHLEHRERDHARALVIARQAADGAALARDDVARAAFERRLARLERKLAATRRDAPA